MMIEKIKNILNSCEKISAWNINEERKESVELYFIKQQLDMNRAKILTEYSVTVYSDFEENGEKYRGSSTVNINPTDSQEEISRKITDASYAASFVRNKWYPLPEKNENTEILEEKETSDLEREITTAVNEFYKEDNKENASVNSSEFYFTHSFNRIINSEGVDVSYGAEELYVEMIVNSEYDGEEVELYNNLEISGALPGFIASKVKDELNFAYERAMAKPTPVLKDVPVILSGLAPAMFFNYYVDNSDCKSIYEKVSDFKIGENVQKNEGKNGVTMYVDPNLKGSVYSRPYDDDGLKLEKVLLVENGVLKNYWGNTRYSSYLGLEPTGQFTNVVVEKGSDSIDSLRSDKYLEVEKFSDFDMDTVTGDFGGEIRLGWYFNGEKRIPVTGGSVTGNIKDVQKSMELSNETNQLESYSGPAYIKLFNASIAGVE